MEATGTARSGFGDLRGRVAVVTGSSRGLGAATAVRLASMGATTVVTYRTGEEEAAGVARQIQGSGGSALVRHLDMGDMESVGALFDWIEGPGGPGGIDVLVANAAATSFKRLLDQRPHNVARTFDISVTGFLGAVQRAVPVMSARGGGRVVAVSGVDTRGYGPTHGLLAAAKAAMEMLVRYLQIELAGTGVTVIGVNPDSFRSQGPALMFGEVYDRLMRLLSAVHPMGAIPEPEEMADVVALCCTDAAARMAGHTLDADGGFMFATPGKLVELAMTLPPETLEASIRALGGPGPTADPDGRAVG